MFSRFVFTIFLLCAIASPAFADDFALVQQAIRTTAGTQDFTVAGFGTPKGAAVFITNGTVNGTVVSHAILGIGFTDGTRSVSGGWHSKDAVTTTVTGRIATTSRLMTVLDQDAATLVQASFDSWVTDGIRINVTTAPASAYLVTVLLIGGTGVSNVYVNSVSTPSTIDTSTDVTAIGFRPDAFLTFDIGRTTFNDTNSTGNRIGFGVVARNAGNPHPQFTVAFNDANGVTTTSIGGRNNTSRVMTDGSSAPPATGIEIQDFSTSSPYFKAFLRDVTGVASTMGYLAIKLNTLTATALQVDSPTSTGASSINGLGINPQFGILVQHATTANDSHNTGGNAEVFGLALFTRSQQFSVAFTSDDAVTTSNAEAVTHDRAIFLRKDGLTFMDGTFTGFAQDVANFNYSTADGSIRKWVGLFIEGSAQSTTRRRTFS